MLEVLAKRERTLKFASDVARWTSMWERLRAYSRGKTTTIDRQFEFIDESQGIDSRLKIYDKLHGQDWEDSREGVLENFHRVLGEMVANKEKAPSENIFLAQVDELTTMISILENEDAVKRVDGLFENSRALGNLPGEDVPTFRTTTGESVPMLPVLMRRFKTIQHELDGLTWESDWKEAFARASGEDYSIEDGLRDRENVEALHPLVMLYASLALTGNGKDVETTKAFLRDFVEGTKDAKGEGDKIIRKEASNLLALIENETIEKSTAPLGVVSPTQEILNHVYRKSDE